MKKNELIKVASKIIEETKKEQEKYHYERVTIFKLMENLDIKFNLDILEGIINIYEKNKKIEEENNKYKKLRLEILKENIKKQKTRKENTIENKIMVFTIIDRENNEYSFFTRESANDFIKENKELFEEKTEIKITANNNKDLERILDSI